MKLKEKSRNILEETPVKTPGETLGESTGKFLKEIAGATPGGGALEETLQKLLRKSLEDI